MSCGFQHGGCGVLAEPFDGLLGLRSGLDDRGFVVFEMGYPVRNIACVVVVNFVGKAQLGADYRLADCRDQFLAGIVLVAEAFAEGAVETVFCGSGVDSFVRSCGYEQVRSLEKVAFRENDQVVRRGVIGLIAAMDRGDRYRVEKGLSVDADFNCRFWRCRFGKICS